MQKSFGYLKYPSSGALQKFLGYLKKRPKISGLNLKTPIFQSILVYWSIMSSFNSRMSPGWFYGILVGRSGVFVGHSFC